MLFDLRSSGRRRTIRVVYFFLAVLLGGGLIFFGVGGSVGGGLLDAVNNSNGGGGSSDALVKQARQLERRATNNPANPHLWAQAAQVRYEDASSSGNYDSTTGAYTKDGVAKLKLAVTAWDKYMAKDPAKPDTDVAAMMVQPLAQLGHYAKSATAAEIVADAQPSAGSYTQLAEAAYLASQTRKGDLAATKAESLAPKDQRATVKSNIEDFKAQLASAASQTGG